jgi:hypothetical protein
MEHDLLDRAGERALRAAAAAGCGTPAFRRAVGEAVALRKMETRAVQLMEIAPRKCIPVSAPRVPAEHRIRSFGVSASAFAADVSTVGARWRAWAVARLTRYRVEESAVWHGETACMHVVGRGPDAFLCAEVCRGFDAHVFAGRASAADCSAIWLDGVGCVDALEYTEHLVVEKATTTYTRIHPDLHYNSMPAQGVVAGDHATALDHPLARPSRASLVVVTAPIAATEALRAWAFGADTADVSLLEHDFVLEAVFEDATFAPDAPLGEEAWRSRVVRNGKRGARVVLALDFDAASRRQIEIKSQRTEAALDALRTAAADHGVIVRGAARNCVLRTTEVGRLPRFSVKRGHALFVFVGAAAVTPHPLLAKKAEMAPLTELAQRYWCDAAEGRERTFSAQAIAEFEERMHGVAERVLEEGDALRRRIG